MIGLAFQATQSDTHGLQQYVLILVIVIVAAILFKRIKWK